MGKLRLDIINDSDDIRLLSDKMNYNFWLIADFLNNIKGEKGDRGDTGPSGIKGEKGDAGADGSKLFAYSKSEVISSTDVESIRNFIKSNNIKIGDSIFFSDGSIYLYDEDISELTDDEVIDKFSKSNSTYCADDRIETIAEEDGKMPILYALYYINNGVKHTIITPYTYTKNLNNTAGFIFDKSYKSTLKYPNSADTQYISLYNEENSESGDILFGSYVSKYNSIDTMTLGYSNGMFIRFNNDSSRLKIKNTTSNDIETSLNIDLTTGNEFIDIDEDKLDINNVLDITSKDTIVSFGSSSKDSSIASSANINLSNNSILHTFDSDSISLDFSNVNEYNIKSKKSISIGYDSSDINDKGGNINVSSIHDINVNGDNHVNLNTLSNFKNAIGGKINLFISNDVTGVLNENRIVINNPYNKSVSNEQTGIDIKSSSDLDISIENIGGISIKDDNFNVDINTVSNNLLLEGSDYSSSKIKGNNVKIYGNTININKLTEYEHVVNSKDIYSIIASDDKCEIFDSLYHYDVYRINDMYRIVGYAHDLYFDEESEGVGNDINLNLYYIENGKITNLYEKIKKSVNTSANANNFYSRPEYEESSTDYNKFHIDGSSIINKSDQTVFVDTKYKWAGASFYYGGYGCSSTISEYNSCVNISISDAEVSTELHSYHSGAVFVIYNNEIEDISDSTTINIDSNYIKNFNNRYSKFIHKKGNESYSRFYKYEVQRGNHPVYFFDFTINI